MIRARQTVQCVVGVGDDAAVGEPCLRAVAGCIVGVLDAASAGIRAGTQLRRCIVATDTPGPTLIHFGGQAAGGVVLEGLRGVVRILGLDKAIEFVVQHPRDPPCTVDTGGAIAVGVVFDLLIGAIGEIGPHQSGVGVVGIARDTPQRISAGRHFAGAVIAGATNGSSRVGLFGNAVLRIVDTRRGLGTRRARDRARHAAREFVATLVECVVGDVPQAVGFTRTAASCVIHEAGGNACNVERGQIASGVEADAGGAAQRLGDAVWHGPRQRAVAWAVAKTGHAPHRVGDAHRVQPLGVPPRRGVGRGGDTAERIGDRQHFAG